MDQSGDGLSALLSDPEKLSAAGSAVSSMLGNASPSEHGEETVKKPALPEKQSEGAALLRALKPFLSSERQQRADKAIRLLTLAALAAEFNDLR